LLKLRASFFLFCSRAFFHDIFRFALQQDFFFGRKHSVCQQNSHTDKWQYAGLRNGNN